MITEVADGNTLAKDLDKRKCSLVTRVWCYVCDVGLKREE